MKKKVTALCLVCMIIFAFAALVTAKPVKAAEKETWKVTMHKPAQDNVSDMFYSIKGSKGHLIIIDGGYACNAKKIRRLAKQNHNTIDAWILTHPHNDHVEAFIEYIKKGYQKKNKITTVYAQKFKHGFKNCFIDYKKALKKCNVIEYKEGTKFYIGNMKFRFYNAWSASLQKKLDTADAPTLQSERHNEYSGVFKAYVKKNEELSILFTGDITERVQKILVDKNGKKLKADCLQVPHHGRCLTEDFLTAVSPHTAFFNCDDKKVSTIIRSHIKLCKDAGIKCRLRGMKNKSILFVR